MAITKIIGAIHPPKDGGRYRGLKNTINYILDPKKTENGLYTGAINCFTETALKEMIETKEFYGKTSSKKTERLGYHMAISFHPEEIVSSEKAFNVVREFAEKYLGSEYEAVYSVHTDCDHLHGHICFNSVNLKTGYKYRYEDGDWAKKIQPIVDEICEKYGLHTLAMDTGITNEEYEQGQQEKKKQRYYRKREHQTENRGGKSNNKYHKDENEFYSWNDHLRQAIDSMVMNSSSYEEFQTLLKENGYQIKKGNSEKYGPYIKIKAPGMGIFRKTYQLGREYTLSRITERILLKTKPMPEYIVPEGFALVVPIRYFVRMKQRPLSATMKKYYARLYRLGIKPHYPNRFITYQDVKEATKKAEHMERQMMLVIKYGVGTVESADKMLKECMEKLTEIKREKQEIKEAHMPYAKVVRLYKKLRKMRSKVEKLSGAEKEEEEAKCNLLKKEIEKYGIDEEKLHDYVENYGIKMKELHHRLREAEKDVEAATVVRTEFDMEEEPYTEEMNKFYNSLSGEEKELQKGRAKQI